MSTNSRRRNKCTISKKSDFDAKEAAASLWSAVQGIGTDEDLIISVVFSCNNAQRQELKKTFHSIYQKDLIKEFKAELKIQFSPDFKQLLLALFKEPVVYDAKCLKRATKGPGTDERLLVEVLLTRTHAEMQAIREEYTSKYGIDLERDVADDTSGDFRKFSFTLSRGNRNNTNRVNEQEARDIAREIHTTYTRLRGTSDPRYNFISLCCVEGYPQLRKVFHAYTELTQEDIKDFIEREFSGDLAEGLKWAVKCAESIPAFFAYRLHKSMEGLGSHHHMLTRIIVSRSEVDLRDICAAYEQMYNRTLEAKVKGHTMGGYRKLLTAIIRGNQQDHPADSP